MNKIGPTSPHTILIDNPHSRSLTVTLHIGERTIEQCVLTLYRLSEAAVKSGLTLLKTVVTSDQFKSGMQTVAGSLATITPGILAGAATGALTKGLRDACLGSERVTGQLDHFFPVIGSEPSLGQNILKRAASLAGWVTGGTWGMLSGSVEGMAIGAVAGYESYQADQGIIASIKQAHARADYSDQPLVLEQSGDHDVPEPESFHSCIGSSLASLG